jgi:hypothetical protein
MNWGHKIALSFILFAAFIMYMVVRAFQEDIDLVSEDYYAQEIKHEDKMRQIANFNELETQVELKQLADQISFTFPKQSEASGQIHFYHTSRKIFDKSYAIGLDENFQQRISKSDLAQGSYRVKITWLADGKEYFQQHQLFVQ